MDSNYQNQIIKKLIQEKVKNTEEFFKVLRKTSKKFQKPFPSNVKLLEAYRKLNADGKIKPNKNLENILKTRKMRSLSGITSITVITSPDPKWASQKGLTCPGNCIYCPQEAKMPKSYLANEPACMRAELTQFDPYRQVKTRIESLKATGHSTDKIELIVLGGTWSIYPKKYQSWFIQRCLDAANQKNSKNLKIAQKLNEKSKNRIIGITLETRPDYVTKQEIKRMRELGCTRIELGVQSVYNEVLKYNKRMHDINATIEATKLLKNAGFKITYHIMLNLPGSTLKKDEKMFDRLFCDPDFCPDQLKIYPCVVLKTAPLYKLWKAGKYKPYSKKQLVDLLIKVKQKIPYYVRIIRVIRDIPAQSIVAGNKMSNLREVIYEEMKKNSNNCKCIRCREPKGKSASNLKLFRQDYNASDGKEIFLSYEDSKRKNIYAFLRLRITNNWSILEIKNSAIIRELHTYGEVAQIKKKKSKELKLIQHQGLGRKLMARAEEIAKKEFNYKKISVIAGLGVRGYYRKLNYRLIIDYMLKLLK